MIAYAPTIAMTLNSEEPRTYDEAISSKDQGKWKMALEEEMESLHKNGTWKLIKKPPNTKVIGCQWIYKIKEGSTESDPPSYKSRLVAKEYTQREGVDFTDVFSQVVKHTSIRVILAVVAQFGLFLEQMDVKTSFLHENLEERILMKQPKGFEDKTKADWVCLLQKSL